MSSPDQQVSDNDVPRLLSLDDVADNLSKSTKTGRRMAYTGELRGVRVNGTPRFDPRHARGCLIEHCGWTP